MVLPEAPRERRKVEVRDALGKGVLDVDADIVPVGPLDRRHDCRLEAGQAHAQQPGRALQEPDRNRDEYPNLIAPVVPVPLPDVVVVPDDEEDHEHLVRAQEQLVGLLSHDQERAGPERGGADRRDDAPCPVQLRRLVLVHPLGDVVPEQHERVDDGEKDGPVPEPPVQQDEGVVRPVRQPQEDVVPGGEDEERHHVAHCQHAGPVADCANLHGLYRRERGLREECRVGGHQEDRVEHGDEQDVERLSSGGHQAAPRVRGHGLAVRFAPCRRLDEHRADPLPCAAAIEPRDEADQREDHRREECHQQKNEAARNFLVRGIQYHSTVRIVPVVLTCISHGRLR